MEGHSGAQPAGRRGAVVSPVLQGSAGAARRGRGCERGAGLPATLLRGDLGRRRPVSMGLWRQGRVSSGAGR